jgi:prepilin-type N-terminal cleavage/methylation domain-containing protein
MRRAFTLLEVMVAMTVSSVIVTLAYATLRAGTDAQTRVALARNADADLIGARGMLLDALRHMLAADARDPRAMRVERDTRGSLTRLTFTSRGVTAPLGGTAPWRCTLAQTDAGVAIEGRAEDGSQVPLAVSMPSVRRMTVRFLARADGNWSDDPGDPTRLPVAIAIDFLDAQGALVTPTLLARTSPVGAL